MDKDYVFSRNRDDLIRIVASLFVMLGLKEGVTLMRVPRKLRIVVLRILRPAESAVRRIIVVLAHGLVVAPPPERSLAKAITRTGTRPRKPSFRLWDIRKNFSPRVRYAKNPPRIHNYWDDRPVVAAQAPFHPPYQGVDPDRTPSPDDPVDATRLVHRLEAVRLALADLPKQARRLALWRARRAPFVKSRFQDPLRPGSAPGWRKKPRHEVDDILSTCQWLVNDLERAVPS